MSLDKGEVSNIERDLMRSYIRQYYDAFLSPQSYRAASSRIAETPPAKTTAPEPAAVVEPTPPPAPEPLPQRVKVEPAKPTPASVPEPQPTAPQAKPKSPAIAALFKQQVAKELSEKLGNHTVTDLTKAMSINDKLLYANELFGRDMSAMNTKLQALNKLGSWDEAEQQLVQLAEEYNWTEEERVEIAQSFIKLVRRKF